MNELFRLIFDLTKHEELEHIFDDNKKKIVFFLSIPALAFYYSLYLQVSNRTFRPDYELEIHCTQFGSNFRINELI